MVLILGLSVLALAVMLWRGMALRESRILPAKVLRGIEEMARHSDGAALERLVEENGSPLAAVIRTVFEHRHWPMTEAREAATTRARHEVARMERGLVFLEIATGVAPLLGLLGTLSGLVGVFANFGGGGDPALVARGIAEALNTTIAGLCVAAPSLIAHNYYARKVEMMAIEMEAAVGELMEKLYDHCVPEGGGLGVAGPVQPAPVVERVGGGL